MNTRSTIGGTVLMLAALFGAGFGLVFFGYEPEIGLTVMGAVTAFLVFIIYALISRTSIGKKISG